MFHVLYLFVTYLLILPLIYSQPSDTESELEHSYRLLHDNSLEENEGNRKD
jgi:hypothetical protein